MGGRCLWDLAIGAGLYRMDEIWEPNGILNEENWDVVSNDIFGRLVMKHTS